MKLSNEEQLTKIKAIMGNTSKDVPDFRFKFGKHQHRTLEYVLKYDRSYLLWLYNNSEKLPKKLENFIERVVLKGFQ